MIAGIIIGAAAIIGGAVYIITRKPRGK